jgi:hypothetical protein
VLCVHRVQAALIHGYKQLAHGTQVSGTLSDKRSDCLPSAGRKHVCTQVRSTRLAVASHHQAISRAVRTSSSLGATRFCLQSRAYNMTTSRMNMTAQEWTPAARGTRPSNITPRVAEGTRGATETGRWRSSSCTGDARSPQMQSQASGGESRHHCCPCLQHGHR